MTDAAENVNLLDEARSAVGGPAYQSEARFGMKRPVACDVDGCDEPVAFHVTWFEDETPKGWAWYDYITDDLTEYGYCRKHAEAIPDAREPTPASAAA